MISLLNKYFSFILTILDKCKNVVIMNENFIKRVETIIKCVHTCVIMSIYLINLLCTSKQTLSEK